MPISDAEALALIKTELKGLDPALEENDSDDIYRTGVLLLAAHWTTGADLEALIRFTGYTRAFVANVYSRMLKAGLWEENGIVHTEHWKQDNFYLTAVFWADVLVGSGEVIAEPTGNSEFRYRRADMVM